MSEQNGAQGNDGGNVQWAGAQAGHQQAPDAQQRPDTQQVPYGQQPQPGTHAHPASYAQPGTYAHPGAYPQGYGRPAPQQTPVEGEPTPFAQPGYGPQDPYDQQYGQQYFYAQQDPYSQVGPYARAGSYPQAGPYGQAPQGQPGVYGPPGYVPPAGYGPSGAPGDTGPKKPWRSGWFIWVAAAVVVVLIVGVVLLGLSLRDDDPQPKAEPGTAQPSNPADPQASSGGSDAGGQTVGLGEAVALDEVWTVAVEAPTMDDTDAVMSYNSSNEEPGDGNVYATVSTTVTNNGSEPISMFWGLYISYYDESGQEYVPATALIPGDAWGLDKIPPGETATGSWGFIIPEGTSGGHWEVTTAESWQTVKVANS